jgi:hypothetical protein
LGSGGRPKIRKATGSRIWMNFPGISKEERGKENIREERI